MGGISNPSPIKAIGSDKVSTPQTTNATTYVDLATVGPQVALVTGTEVLIDFGAELINLGGNQNGYMAVAVSGATTIAADDINGIEVSITGGFAERPSRRMKLTGLTPGLNTFTLKYRTGNQNIQFLNRDLIVLAL